MPVPTESTVFWKIKSATEAGSALARLSVLPASSTLL